MKLAISALALLLFSPALFADSISQTITADSPIPLDAGIADTLAQNILTAQITSGYGSPLSLEDSIVSVERAITISETVFGDTTLTAANDWLPILQSEIAINPNAGFVLTFDGQTIPNGGVIDLGTFILVPEPNEGWFVGLGFLIVGLSCLLTGSRKIYRSTRLMS